LKPFFTIACLLVHFGVNAQVGCLDPQAQNWGSGFQSSDTSCLYPVTQIGTLPKIISMNSQLNEASALVRVNGRLFTLNDSGNNADLFEIDTTSGAVLKKTRITNFPNVDWEELTVDENNFYIGDFGNNNGDRTNLRVLAVSKAAVLHPDSLNVTARAIRFSYPDQTSFTSSNTNNFDCEAFFFTNGKLHLFSKNRGNRKSKYYTLDPSLATQTAVLKGELDVRGLITGASLRPDGKVAILLGLGGTDLSVFAWLLFGYEGEDYLSANRRRIDLPQVLTSGQAEGICFSGEYRVFHSNEKVSAFIPASIRQFNIANYLQPFFTTETRDRLKAEGTFFRQDNQTLYFSPEVNHIEISTTDGKLWYKGLANEISTAGWPSGLYISRMILKNKKLKTEKILIP